MIPLIPSPDPGLCYFVGTKPVAQASFVDGLGPEVYPHIGRFGQVPHGNAKSAEERQAEVYRKGHTLNKRRSMDILGIWPDVVAGDMTAWRLIVHAYTPLVLTVARRAGLSLDDVEDCAQQTWIALYRHRGAVDTPRAVPAWLIRTAHRKALTMHRNLARRADLQHLIDAPPSVPMPDQEVIALEEAAHVRLAFDQLDPRCRRLLGKLFLEDAGESYDSIARNLRIKLNSVGPLRSRCLEKLRKNLLKLGVKVD